MLRNYLVIALRNLWKNRAFTAINIGGLSLGIACALAIFMIVEYEWSFDRFRQDYKRLYRMVTEVRFEQDIEHQSGIPLPFPRALATDFPEIKKIGKVFANRDVQIDVHEGAARFKEEDGVAYVNPAFFELFPSKWLYGSAATVLSKPNQMALTKSLAEKYFGSWQQAIGKTIKKDNAELLQVSGIMEDPPSNTDLPFRIAISYATFEHTPFYRSRQDDWGSISSRSQCYILLPEDLSIDEFNKRLAAFRVKYLSADDTDYFIPQPLNDLHFNTDYNTLARRTVSKQTLWSLALIGVFLLVLAGINFVNLATAQATKRSREVGIRKVLGSQRWQLGLQFMGETFCIVCIAGLLAIGLVSLFAPLSHEVVRQTLDLQPWKSFRAIGFTATVVILVTLLAGFYPAIIISGFRPVQALKSKIMQQSNKGISLRRVLVTGQFVIAQALIIGTIVVISQVDFVRSASLGFNKDAIITVPLPGDSVSRAKYNSFREALLQQPGVQTVSLSYTAPAASTTNHTSIQYDNHTEEENFQLNLKPADADYLKTYNVQLVAGRFYNASDTMREMVVNETFLKKVGVRDPQQVLGKYMSTNGRKVLIVGVVKDFHTASLRDPIDAVGMTTLKRNYQTAGIKLEGATMTASLPAIQKLYAATFPEYLYQHQFLDETIGNFYEQEQRLSNIFKIFAGMGILISCMGLYGLILFLSVQRVKEVGVRKVLGASSFAIVLLFVREFVVLIGIAFLIASPLAWYGMHEWLQNFAYRINISWWVFALTGITALLIALGTISFQAIKAAVVNPVKSLRSE